MKFFRNDELVKGSFLLLIMLVLFNLFNYIFQISMAKLLGPADFSIVATLMSIIYISNVPAETIQTVVARYASKFYVKRETGKTKDLLYKSIKKGTKIATVLFILFIPFSFFLSLLLNIPVLIILITALISLFIFSLPVQRGIMQGRKEFKFMGLSMVSESFFKIILSISLVFLGLGVYGAMGGVVAASGVAFFFSFLMLKDVVGSKREVGEFDGIYKDNFPVLISVAAIVLMYSLDVILARIFFSPTIAGQYAFASLVGKVILFIGLAITKTMFPLSTQTFEDGRKTSKILQKSMILILIVSSSILIFYFFIPELVIKIVSINSPEYLPVSPILFFLGLSYSLLSVANLIIFYKVSINKINLKQSYFLFLFVIFQILVLSFNHKSLVNFSLAFLFVNTIMFLYSLFLAKK